MIKKLAYFTLGMSLMASSANADTPYRILITNDDGIDAPGLKALVAVLADDAEIIVSAPAEKASSTSHATYLWSHPIKAEEVTLAGSTFSYAVYGQPADAARFGILMMKQKGMPIDLVISGINSGENVGSAAHLSGTVGAAAEAVYYDLPSIAVSLAEDSSDKALYQNAAAFIDSLVPEVRKHGLGKGVMLNVNVPDEIKGVKTTPMGDYTISVDHLEKEATGAYVADISYPASQLPGSDSYEFERGFITVAPLNIDMTDKAMLKQMEGWNLKFNK